MRASPAPVRAGRRPRRPAYANASGGNSSGETRRRKPRKSGLIPPGLRRGLADQTQIEFAGQRRQICLGRGVKYFGRPPASRTAAGVRRETHPPSSAQLHRSNGVPEHQWSARCGRMSFHSAINPSPSSVISSLFRYRGDRAAVGKEPWSTRSDQKTVRIETQSHERLVATSSGDRWPTTTFAIAG